MKEIEEVCLSLLSTKDFQDEKVVSDILGEKNNSPFIPYNYGFCEPLKFKYENEDISGPLKLWMHEEVNRKLAKYNQQSGSLMMVSKNEGRGFFHFDWDKLPLLMTYPLIFDIMQFYRYKLAN